MQTELRKRSKMVDFRIGQNRIGFGLPVFIIAEAGVNHNGDVVMAKRLIEAASAAGVDAVKFQTFSAERVASAHAAKAAYQLETTDRGESQIEMLKRLELAPEAFRDLKLYAESNGLIFLSTPHDEESIEILEMIDVIAYKVGSGDITNTPFLESIARIGKPVLLSTGMSTLEEVRTAVDTIRGEGNLKIILLHCVSDYPALVEDSNLRVLKTLRDTFHVPVGYSDHSTGQAVTLAAVALGACTIEKHFTIDRTLSGPDHSASIEPDELKWLVENIRIVERSLGTGNKAPTAREMANRDAVRKSVFAACDISASAIIERSMLTVKRPGTGLQPMRIREIVGKQTRIAIPADTPIEWEMLHD